jgi:hypothetical protein
MKWMNSYLGLLLLGAGAAADEPAVLSKEFLFEKAPHAQCHASTITQTSKGHLVAAWFGGTRERNEDVGIWLTRQVEGKWTEPVEVANAWRWPTVCNSSIRRE